MLTSKTSFFKITFTTFKSDISIVLVEYYNSNSTIIVKKERITQCEKYFWHYKPIIHLGKKNNSVEQKFVDQKYQYHFDLVSKVHLLLLLVL